MPFSSLTSLLTPGVQTFNPPMTFWEKLLGDLGQAALLIHLRDRRICYANPVAVSQLGLKDRSRWSQIALWEDPDLPSNQQTWHALTSRLLRQQSLTEVPAPWDRLYQPRINLYLVHSSGDPLGIALWPDPEANPNPSLDFVLLNRLTRTIGHAQTVEEALALTLGEVATLAQWDVGEVWTVETNPDTEEDCLRFHGLGYCNPQWQDIQDSGDLPLTQFPHHSRTLRFQRGEGLPGRVWTTGQALWVEDVTQEPWFLRRHLARKCGLRGGVGIPICAGDRVIAVMLFFLLRARSPQPTLIALVGSVAAQLGEIIQRKRAESDLRRAEAKYRGIFESALEGIFQTTPSGQYLSANPALAQIYGYDSPEALLASLTDIGHQLYVDPHRRQTFIQLLQDQEFVANFESRVYRRDRTVIWISENARAVRDEQGQLLYYQGTVEDITEKKRIKEELHFRACYDPLTGLANRALFREALEASLRDCPHPQGFALLFLDLDRFKVINDSLGHLVGDHLLIAVARTLERCVREQDLVARLGGDEFTILLTGVGDPERAIQVAERIQTELSHPFLIEQHRHDTEGHPQCYPIYTGASIGILLSQDYLGRECADLTPEDLLRDADTALYAAKAAGKGCYQVFHRGMHTSAVAVMTREMELRRALDRGEFVVHYQPIWYRDPLDPRRLWGIEALLRWQHPQRGLLETQDFLAQVEEIGLINALEQWFLQEAGAAFLRWQGAWIARGGDRLHLHCNLAPGQLHRRDWLDTLQVLGDRGLSPQDLCLEFQEQDWPDLDPQPGSPYHALLHLGVGLCLDSFGNHDFSLKGLQQPGVEVLKLSATLVQSLETDGVQYQIAQAVVQLAQSLGKKVIAVTPDPSRPSPPLQRLGLDLVQGGAAIQTTAAMAACLGLA